MGETIAQHTGPIAAIFAALLAILVIGILIAKRRARRRHHAPLSVVTPLPVEPPAPPVEPSLDVSGLTAAIHEAETSGEPERMPALYLSLANQRLAAGEAAEAAELLRKCIRAAATAPHKAVHAKARLILGDIAHADGDLTTACEHWQIARAIFHELNERREHAEAETRMLSNGCPTDWVLTDF